MWPLSPSGAHRAFQMPFLVIPRGIGSDHPLFAEDGAQDGCGDFPCNEGKRTGERPRRGSLHALDMKGGSVDDP